MQRWDGLQGKFRQSQAGLMLGEVTVPFLGLPKKYRGGKIPVLTLVCAEVSEGLQTGSKGGLWLDK